jgi:hypothetical protein
MGNAENSGESVHNDRDGRQQVTSEQRIRLVISRFPLGYARILCRIDGQQGKTGCPEIKCGSTGEGLETVCETRHTRASFTRSPSGLEDG